jgi:hypothetical protein
MRNDTPKRAEPSPAKAHRHQSLFNLAKRTPQGNRVICKDLTFEQVTGLVPELPAAVVKFSRMEVLP